MLTSDKWLCPAHNNWCLRFMIKTNVSSVTFESHIYRGILYVNCCLSFIAMCIDHAKRISWVVQHKTNENILYVNNLLMHCNTYIRIDKHMTSSIFHGYNIFTYINDIIQALSVRVWLMSFLKYFPKFHFHIITILNISMFQTGHARSTNYRNRQIPGNKCFPMTSKQN